MDKNSKIHFQSNKLNFCQFIPLSSYDKFSRLNPKFSSLKFDEFDEQERMQGRILNFYA
jgi:hypothetical protein